MARKPTYKSPPAAPINAWVRDALEFADLSQTALADALTREGLGSYDRSKVQKMTVSRGVSFEEAQAISRLTGLPLLEDQGSEFDRGFHKLNDSNRKAVLQLMRSLLAGQREPE